MTDGLAPVDGDAEGKYHREKYFPVEVGERGLQVTLETAKASMEADRVRILNTIVGRTGNELKAPVMESHGSYQILNDTLAGRFAAAMLRPLLDADKPLDLCLQRLQRSGLKSLQLNFGECSRFDRAVAVEVFESIPSVLAELDLRGSGLRAGHCDGLAKLIKASAALKKLILFQNTIGDEGGKVIAHALAVNASLAELDLSKNQIGAKGAIAIGEALKANGSLNWLNLERNLIGNDGGVAIGEALKANGSLTTLFLGDNEIGDQGGVAIAEALTVNASLMSLNLSANKIGDEGGVAIANALAGNTSLTDLNLLVNKIGDEGGIAIGKALSFNASLTTLDLSFNPDIAATTQEELRCAAKSTLELRLM